MRALLSFRRTSYLASMSPVLPVTGILGLVYTPGCADEQELSAGADETGVSDEANDSGSAGDSSPEVSSSGGVPVPEVWCGDGMTCSDILSTCCFKLDLAALDLVGRCVYEPRGCSMDESFLACDDRSDCGGTPCCVSQVNAGGNQLLMGQCSEDSMGCGLADEICQGQGNDESCTGNGYCCQSAGDPFGSCVADEAACEALQSEE